MSGPIRRWLRAHGVRWHAQNLDRDGRGQVWRHGRAWVDVFTGDGDTGRGYRELFQINPEWVLRFENAAALSVSVGGGDTDRDLSFQIGLPVAAVYLTISSLPRSLCEAILPGKMVEYNGRRFKMTEEHEVSVRWHDNAVWWAFWYSTMSWHSKDPAWRRGSFHPVDFLLGRTVYHKRTVDERGVQIPMPERSYPATVELHEDTWTRPRWPFPRRILRATIECPDGVPIPGKGTASYNCDEDATYSMTAPARNITEAVVKMVASATRDRINRGGANWRPAVPAAGV